MDQTKKLIPILTRNENILQCKASNSSQTVEIKDKTNEKKPYLEQNISNYKLDR